MSRNVRKLLSVLRPWAYWLPVVSLASVAVNLLEMAVPVYLRSLVNGVFGEGGRAVVPWGGVAALAGLLVLAQALKIAQRLATEWPATRVGAALFRYGVHHLLSHQLHWFAENHSGAVQVRLERSARAIADLLKVSVTDILSPLVGVVIALCLIWWADPYIGAVTLLSVPLLVLLTAWQVNSQAGIRIALNRAREEQGVRVAEAVLGIEQVKLFRAGREEVERVGSVALALADQEFSHHRAMARFDLAKFWVERLGFGAVLVCSILAALRPGSTLGAGGVLMLVLLYERVAETMRQLHRLVDETHEKLLLAKDYLGLLDADPPARPVLAPRDGVGGALRCEHVSFTYPGASAPSLKEVSFTAAAGARVAVIGASGSGKSTLAKILSGLYRPDAGRVLIGGREVSPVESADGEGALVGMLSQDIYIFAGTIAENIRYGRPSATDEQVRQAAAIASLAEDIEALPDGYDTILGQRGHGLSGGQKQRLALARVVLQDPEVVIFDEPSSSLDPNNARRFYENVLRAFEGKTVVVITHDLANLTWMDVGILMDKGRVRESGPLPKIQAGLELRHLRGRSKTGLSAAATS